MTDNRTTELRISKPLLGFIKHQRNRGYIDAGQAQWLFNIADEIDAKHEQAIAATLGNDRITEDSIDKWLREFQREHKELAHIGLDELRDLAYALHDDIPLGYEASMRLADWLLHATLGKDGEVVG